MKFNITVDENSVLVELSADGIELGFRASTFGKAVAEVLNIARLGDARQDAAIEMLSKAGMIRMNTKAS